MFEQLIHFKMTFVFPRNILLGTTKRTFRILFLIFLFFIPRNWVSFFHYFIFSLQVTKRRRIVARVQCRNIKNECPKLDCDEPVQLPGKCCKACPGKTNGKHFVLFGMSKLDWILWNSYELWYYDFTPHNHVHVHVFFALFRFICKVWSWNGVIVFASASARCY